MTYFMFFQWDTSAYDTNDANTYLMWEILDTMPDGLVDTVFNIIEGDFE